jgi:hypothetical protein
MLELGQHRAFLQKPTDAGGVGQGGAHQLERHLFVHVVARGEVDGAHPAAPKLPFDAVRPHLRIGRFGGRE